MDQANMDRHVIKIMAALGLQFKLGDLYNYRTDHILTGNFLNLCKVLTLSLKVKI